MLRSMPPVSAVSNCPETSPSIAEWRAAMEEAQAASVTKLGPPRLSALATRPAMMLDSSPGMVSSVMPAMRWRISLPMPLRIDNCRSGGSSLKSGTASRAWMYSGR